MKKLDLKLFSKICILTYLLYFPLFTQAEGTKQLAPNPSDRVFLYSNVTSYGNFASYGSGDVQRLYININDPNNEQVFLGFSRAASSGHYPCEGTEIDIYFRIMDPNGVVVYPTRGNPAGQLLSATNANITTKAQAMNGPVQIVGEGGYDGFVFDPVGYIPGDYYIEFSRNESTPSLNEYIALEWWDISVATKEVAPTAIDGRVYAKNWSLMTPSISCGQDPTYNWFDRGFNGSFYVYTEERIIARTDFNGGGLQAAAFNVFFNDAGTKNTGNVIEDRRSLLAERTNAAQHRIFLNDPDITVYPSGRLGFYALNPTFLACEDGAGCVKAAVTEPGQIDVLVDFDKASGPFVYDKGTADVLIAFKVEPLPGESSPYLRCIPWDGRDGFGNKVKEGEEVDLFVRYTQGIYHFPIYDAEFFLNGFIPTTVRPFFDREEAHVYYDDVNITIASGTSEPIEDSFNGCVAPCHKWTEKDYGNLNTINTWFFATEETNLELETEECPIAAVNDRSETIINQVVTIPILDNDKEYSVINKDVISLGDLSPTNGTVSFNPLSGDATYTPNNTFIGKDSFRYVICFDIVPANALCTDAIVYVDVLPADIEDCSNGFDDDGDGLADCDDPDCLPETPGTIKRGE